jgi:hypothetical protein
MSIVTSARALSFLLLFALSTAFTQEILNNSSIIKMVKSGLSETIILGVIQQQQGTYSTKVDDLIELKKAGVPDKVIEAMVAKGSATAAEASGGKDVKSAAAPATLPVMEIGVYFKKGDQWTEVLPEVVNWKTGGTIKTLASVGVVKKDINGNLAGPSSRNSVQGPLEFMIVAAEGVAITEYQLIRLRSNKDYREFRTVTGGILNQQSGAMRDMVPFEGKKVSSRTFSVVLPASLGAGEYGFLAPGATGAGSGGAAQLGKMYTFRLVP